MNDIIEENLINFIKENQEKFVKCEKIRNKKVKEFFYQDIIFVVILCIVSCFLLKSPIILGFIAMPVGFIYFLIHKIYEYKVEYKKLCTPVIAKAIGLESVLFDADAKKDELYFKSKLFRNFVFFTISDMFTKNYNKTTYKIIEISMFLTWTHSIFKGIVLTLPNKNTSREHIIIATKGNKIASKAKKINFSHPIYKNEFNIYSVNKMISEKELSDIIPNYIFDVLITLRKTYHCKKIKCAFSDNNIILAIDTNKDLFETASIFKSCFDTKYILSNMLDDLKPIFYIEKSLLR